MPPLAPPRDLTLPRPGSQTLRRVLGLVLKETVRSFFSIPPGRFATAVSGDFVRMRALVETQVRGGRVGLVYALVRHPTTSALIRCIDRELWGDGDVTKLDAWLAELNGQLAYGFARHEALPAAGIELRRLPRRILCPDAGIEIAFDAGALLGPVRFFPGHLAAGQTPPLSCRLLEQESDRGGDADIAPGVSLRRAYRRVASAIRLALVDNNPLSEFEAHPDKSGNALHLGGETEETWIASLRGALSLVDAVAPDLAAELPLILQTIVPVGFEREKHLSASYAEAIGTIYVSLHPNPLTMAEALIHECSHNKLNALFSLDRLLENGFDPLYRSPVRPDPRPLHGILLAAHAFLPVATLFERLRDAHHPLSKESGFEARFTQICVRNQDAITTLREHAKATPVGQAVLDELCEINDRFSAKATAPNAAPDATTG